MFILMWVAFGVGALAACVACGDMLLPLKTYIPNRVRAVALTVALGSCSGGLLLAGQVTRFTAYEEWGVMLGMSTVTFAAFVASVWKGLARNR